MRKTKLLLTLAVLLLGLATPGWAQSEVGTGTFFIKNVSEGTFLTGANKWGTHASLDAHGLDCTLAASGEAYTINTGSKTYLGSDGYVDNGTAADWTIAAVDGMENTYTIYNSTFGYLVATSGSTDLSASNNAPTTSVGYWQFFTQDDMKNALSWESASEENPLDVTFYVDGCNFVRNCDGNRTAWSGSAITGTFGPWTLNAQGTNHTPQISAPTGETQSNTGCEFWNQTSLSLTQAITVPNGKYKLTVDGVSVTENYSGEVAYLVANNDSSDFTNTSTSEDFAAILTNIANYKEVATVTTTVTDGKLTVGIGRDGTGWTVIDNFRLYYLGISKEQINTAYEEAVEAANDVDQSSAMNAEDLQALKDAITNYGSLDTETTSSDDLQTATDALKAATEAATASISAYENAENVLPEMKKLTEETKFYDNEAYETYYNQWLVKYNDKTLTTAEANALVNPHAVIGWHSSAGDVDAFLLDAWDVDATPLWGGAYYINTWSTEGENDGTGMTVPFFEYFAGTDGSTLTDNTMTATLSGLTADQIYKVSMLVRVYASKTPSGVTLQVGEGTATDITTSLTESTSATGYYYGTVSAYGKADSEGTLTVKVATSSTNVGWLAFKNAVYEESSVDYSALEAAIANAQTLNAKVTNGVTSLTNGITTAQGYLTSTSQDEIDAAAETLNSTITAAEPVVTARLRAAGEYKKYTALNEVIGDTDQVEAITALKTAAENADATASNVTEAEEAITLMDDYQTITLTNGCFDESINIAVDGTNSGTMSSKASESKPYIWEVSGWKTDAFTFTNTAAQGTTAAYGATVTGQVGTNGTNPPATDMFGLSEGGTLHISSGWSDQARYQQESTSELPAGTYIFYYEANNQNSGASTINSNYIGVNGLTAGDIKDTQNTFIFDDTKSFTYNEWTACAMGFNLVKATTGTVNVGITGTTGSSTGAAKLWIDNVTIYYIPAKMDTITREYGYKNGTICYPYTLYPCEGTTIYEVAGYDATNKKVVFTEAVEKTEAGKPYIYETTVQEGDNYVATFKYNPEETAATEVAEGKNNLTGIFTSSNFASVGTDNTVHIVQKGKWVKVPTKYWESYSLDENRAYILNMTSMTAATSTETNARSMSVGDDTTTGIDGVTLNAEDGDIYNLRGQKVNNTLKGVYIQNGKKVVIK